MNENRFDPTCEEALLGILLLNPDLVVNILNVKDFMFSASPNQYIFRAIKKMLESGSVPEINSLMMYLKSINELDQAGGKDYFDYLKNLPYKKESILDFEKQIVSNYKARTLISITTDISKSTSCATVDSDIEKVRTALDGLSESNARYVQTLEEAGKVAWDGLVYRINNPGLSGLSWGIKDLDLVTGGMDTGSLVVIAARTSMGKSAFMCNSSLNTAKLNEGNLVFSLEMSSRILTARYWALETGIPITDILAGRINQKQLDQIYEAAKRIKDLPLRMICSFTPSLEYIIATIRQYKKDKDIKRVYIDYLQLLSQRDDDQTAELGRITRALKLLAEELGIVIIILSQLNRMLETRPDKRPILSDLRQSGNIEEDVDMAMLLYRDEIYHTDTKDKGVMEAILRKNRNGPIGMIPLTFEDATNIIKGSR